MRTVFFCIVSTVLFIACGSPANLKLEKEKILALHHAQRDYHFQKDSIAFVNQFSDHFISVNNGIISSPTKEETLQRYQNYFSAVEFVKWDDVQEPIIKFSDDGTMAYSVVEKEVAVRYSDRNNKIVEGRTQFAWTAIFRKENNEWKLACMTSTNRPLEEPIPLK